MASNALTEKYTRLANHQPGVSRVGWLDVLQQQLQFEVFLSLTIPPDASVLDVGCGVGDFLTALEAKGFNGSYTGLDIMPPFIAEAEERFASRPNTRFICTDALECDIEAHDFVFASGLFDYKTPDSPQRWQNTVARLMNLSRKACAWNAYHHLDPTRDDMWAVDLPTAVQRTAQLTPFWHLKADYAPGHFTMFAYKRDYWLTPNMHALIGHLFLNPALAQKLRAEPQELAEQYNLTMQQLNLLSGLIQSG